MGSNEMTDAEYLRWIAGVIRDGFDGVALVSPNRLTALADRLETHALVPKDAEALARQFHGHYERLAPHFGYQTRAESSVPWDAVPTANKQLMVAVCEAMLTASEAK